MVINKSDAVICINPNDRQSRILDFSKKYNFIPILIHARTKDAIGDMDSWIANNIKTIKERIPHIIFYVDNGSDFHKIVDDIKIKYNVLAVCPSCDVSLAYSDRLAFAFGVNGNNPKTTASRKDKGWVNQQLTKNKLRTPITIAFSPKDDISKTTTKILKIFNSFPLVIKPYQGEGSIGVKIIENKSDLKTALNDCAKFCKINPSMSKKFLVQEYIGGTEGFLNFYSFNGKHLLSDAWITRKIMIGGNTLIVDCALMMKKTPLLAKAEAYCKKVLDAIGYKWGPTHIEIKYDKNDICLIEVNMRMMGSHALVQEPISFGYTMPELAFLSLTNSPLLARYLNKNAYEKARNLRQAIYFIEAPHDFVVKKDNVKKIIDKLSSVKSFVSYVKIGDKIKQSIDLDGVLGEIGLVGSEKQVEKDLSELQKLWQNNFNSWYK